MYDQYGAEGLKRGGPPGAGGFGGMFGDLFGFGGGHERHSGPRKGETVRKPLEVTLNDLYNGATRKIKVSRSRNCEPCNGTGASDPSKIKTCGRCKGQGTVTEYRRVGPGFVTQTRSACSDCQGLGKSVDKKFICKECGGKKVVSKKKVLEIHIDKGMKDGQKIVFEGEGDEYPDIIPGDIVFHLKQREHKDFTRKHAHLYMKKKITLSAALTGAEFTIEHLDGRTLLCSSSPGEVIKPGMVKQIENEGMPIYKSPFEHGNMFIEFEIVFPKTIPSNYIDKLNEVLPPKEKVNSNKNMEEVTLMEPDYSQKEQRSSNAYDSDDEMEGQQGVQCATQ
mmetsp:Transcript_5534/g.8173  ORF Transcript_5534/g.8173 Transcript_5534/m.8173 type:complete len:336 (+) Transcript_5534:84-1091(+)